MIHVTPDMIAEIIWADDVRSSTRKGFWLNTEFERKPISSMPNPGTFESKPGTVRGWPMETVTKGHKVTYRPSKQVVAYVPKSYVASASSK